MTSSATASRLFARYLLRRLKAQAECVQSAVEFGG